MIGNSPRTVTDGLVMYFDSGNTSKSYKGASGITNYSWHSNARLDYQDNKPNYASYSASSSGTWNAKHPNAIRVYNQGGSEITGFVNTGVTDWTNTYHAIWTLDPILRRPVVTQRDFDGIWKAWYSGLYGSPSFNSMGLGVGSKYTISWLQWTDTAGKALNTGLYGPNTSGSFDFWDGKSQSTAQNTKLNTWERVFNTYTVSSSRDLASTNLNIYMYGMDFMNGVGTVKATDLQFEVSPYPTGFSYSQTRSSNNSLIDLMGNFTIPATNTTADSTGKLYFNGSSKVTGVQSKYTLGGNSVERSWEVVVKPTASMNYGGIFGHVVNSSCTYHCNGGISIASGVYQMNWYDNSAYQFLSSGVAATSGQYVHIVGTYSSDLKCRIYVNGVLRATSAVTNIYTNSPTVGEFQIGYLSNSGNYFTGYIDIVKYYYNKSLTADEVANNFQAIRGRFGI